MLQQMTGMRIQSDTANAIWNCRAAVSVTEREGICSGDRESVTLEEGFPSESSCVCPSAG